MIKLKDLQKLGKKLPGEEAPNVLGTLKSVGSSPAAAAASSVFSLSSLAQLRTSILPLSLSPVMQYLLYFFLFLILLSGIVAAMTYLDKRRIYSNLSNVERIQGLQSAKLTDYLATSAKNKPGLLQEGFQAAEEPVEPDERLLVNYAPLMVNQPGFLGPLKDGVYREEEGVRLALQAGARAFVIPIDFHQDPNFKAPLFPKEGDPCMLYRDKAGTLRSINSGSIEKVAKALADLAFSDLFANKNDPILLILYVVRAPNPDTETKRYVQYLSKVAQQLKPLLPYHLGQNSLGDFSRQKKQNEVLTMPLDMLQKRVLIFCNADTSAFRNLKGIGLPPLPPDQDLDFLVHIRMFKESNNELGITGIATEKIIPRGWIEPISYFTIIPPNQYKTVVDKTKMRWTLALLPPDGSEVTIDKVKMLLDTMGVQGVPLLLADATDTTKQILDLWTKNSWRPKPKALRFVVPKPVEPKVPSVKMDANQGQLTVPSF
jgi:hypothetical protein